ncbi:hypothetical protein BGX29_009914 [Mortierella sp. GBA35]|nr:hypothetical protein BGX23_000243 [Mortierella sp. AD031]KAF9093458.1 hypothetical protein BGX29_009914 [Mortierella sp. GBA35]KAG0216457.1 hypothetical protein BGX33_012545 [Mortierella sp. NVP41]
MTATTFTSCLPSPGSPLPLLDSTFSPIPDGPLSADARAQLQNELDQIRKCFAESQTGWSQLNASIPTYQQLVLTTHAQVAAAKQAVLQAKGLTPTSSTVPSITNSTSSSSSTSNASSPPSPLSPLNNHMHQDLLNGIQAHGQNLERLEQEHAELGQKLSQVLRDKAEAEENKKRLQDYMTRAKSRIREIEQKLSE